jgi:hypothetical protein
MVSRLMPTAHEMIGSNGNWGARIQRRGPDAAVTGQEGSTPPRSGTAEGFGTDRAKLGDGSMVASS